MVQFNRNSNFDAIKLSKSFIETRVTQETLMQYYLGIPIDLDNLFCSPLRKDETPTCSLYKKHGNLYMKDFSGHFHGDVYNLVAYLHNLDYGDLMGAMKVIVSDHPNVFGDTELAKDVVRKTLEDVKIKEKQSKLLQITVQNWKTWDKEYWKDRYTLSSKDLEFFGAHSCQYVWINGKVIATYHPKDRIYAYDYGKGRLKIYFPDRLKNRFISNTDAIQGFKQLPSEAELVFITKSMKDVMMLRKLGYFAVAAQSEHHNIPEKLIENLRKRFKKIVMFYDNDDAGRKGANKQAEKFDLDLIEVPEIYADCKDISDVVQNYGEDIAHDVMEEITQWI